MFAHQEKDLPRKVVEAQEMVNEYYRLQTELLSLKEKLSELKTAGGCGNISIARHSTFSTSNLKFIVEVDWKGEDSHIIGYFKEKVESQISKLGKEIEERFGG